MGRALIRDCNGTYQAMRRLSEADILHTAEQIIQRRFRRLGSIKCPQDVLNFLHSQLIHRTEEGFGCLFLDGRHQVIAWEVLFTGTVNSCVVHPRVVIKRALELNASAVVCAHHHPSGNPQPSRADETITQRLRDLLVPLDIQLLDHVVIGHQESVSLAERGVI